MDPQNMAQSTQVTEAIRLELASNVRMVESMATVMGCLLVWTAAWVSVVI
jgi:hypothetical protein